MRTRNVRVFAMAFALPGAVWAQGSGAAKAKVAPKAAASRLVVVPASDVKWTDLNPTGAPGVKIADLWGNRVFFAESRGKFDLMLVDAGKAPAQK